MKKVFLCFGTRPEAIKLAPLIKRMKANQAFETKVLITAQHRHMLDQVLNLFDIKPDYDLNLMQPNQDLSDLTSKILLGCKEIFKAEEPDLVMVHGDTTTTFAASLAAFYQKIDVAHVEAGLRTFDLYSPFPEEMNRQFCTKVSKYHFAPTAQSKENLLNEGVTPENVLVTGNTGIDALFDVIQMIKDEPLRIPELKNKKYVLITGHRRENFGEGMENVCRAIGALGKKYPEVHFVYPVHLNPNVQDPVKRLLSNISNVHLIEPLDYLPFINMMKHCFLILTDSGGIQEEAPSLGKPVLVMREKTERPEAVNAGVVKMVGTDSEKIIREVSLLLDDPLAYEKMSKSINPYGDGNSTERILAFLNTILHN